jgi:DNA modification methylase
MGTLFERKDYNYFKDDTNLSEINFLDNELYSKFRKKFKIEPSLTRKLVSFQANKTQLAYRWYKFKEAFSFPLITHLLNTYNVSNGKVLDPFAGSGTTLFAASSLGLDADGIEILPIGHQIILARLCLEREFTEGDFRRLKTWIDEKPWKNGDVKNTLNTLKITDGAYPSETHKYIEQYLGTLQKENSRLRIVLRFALLCILEAISYTRKDGQYLRWDSRSGRRSGKSSFFKKEIINFNDAICNKIREILDDGKIIRSDRITEKGNIYLSIGSCLDILPRLSNQIYDAIITSPPYCNRYDYTRTYALELALLGIEQDEMIQLRQEMLSCTVENRAKDLISINSDWKFPIAIVENHDLLQLIISFLEEKKSEGKLNNNGIPKMVRGYFLEMACVLYECYRIMKENGFMFMVNDNVRYAGVNVSVDMILSDIAEKLGFIIDKILVLPGEKGNSSQQMGIHGRSGLRKCIYVWRKN